MSILERGRLVARLAEDDADLDAALALRRRCFRAGRAPDGDAFDALCNHVLVEDRATGALVCCYRLLSLPEGGAARSYSGQFYDLAALRAYPGPALELGRFCIAPGPCDGDILRVAWAALCRIVDRGGVAMLFGCSSFRGVEPARYGEAFAWLAARHLAPRDWRPGIKAPRVIRFPTAVAAPDARRALAVTPPLLRTYLAMGGWVSDHAVVDADMDTLHVFTGVEIGKVPPARARLLRAMAD